MKKPIQISIPTPCHENWEAMTPADKDRFCASCQKTVIDFSNATDREIAALYKKDKNTCGRFRADQLDRDLVIPKEKNSIWMAASAAIISFIGLGTHDVVAQTPKMKQETQNTPVKPAFKAFQTSAQKKIKGKVTDEKGTPLQNAEVKNITTGTTVNTDKKGMYTITATIGDEVGVRLSGYVMQTIVFNGKMDTITLEKIEEIIMIMGGKG
jgi:hypothetical protein